MKLSQSSLSVRKAAAARGITDPSTEVTPVFDTRPNDPLSEIKVRINNMNITAGELQYASQFPWREIN